MENKAVKTAVIIGADSDIAKAMAPRLLADGYSLFNWKRGTSFAELSFRWDLVIIFVGKVSPVGNWWDLKQDEWEECVQSNLFVPLRVLREIWSKRKNETGCTVIWFAGSNPQKIMNGYSPYNTAKMAVLKLVEQLDHETPDCKFVALGPGYVKTKIHKATLDANWPNERIARGDEGTSMESIYECLKWCVDQPKEMVGGINICVSDLQRLKTFWVSEDFGKMRRVEG